MKKNINKLILKKVMEIIFAVGFVFFSGFLWQGKNVQNVLAGLTEFSNASYTGFTVENPISYSMFPMTNEDAMTRLKPCYIKVNNGTYTKEEYALILKLDKSSTMDYHYLNISVDDQVYSLKDLEQKEEKGEILFYLTRGSIIGEEKTYEIRLWLNTLAGNEMQAKELIMQFDLLNETTQA